MPSCSQFSCDWTKYSCSYWFTFFISKNNCIFIKLDFRTIIDVLAGLQRHPEVRRLGHTVDTTNCWEVCHVLSQLLPIDNSVKYELLGITDIHVYIEELDTLLSELSG